MLTQNEKHKCSNTSQPKAITNYKRCHRNIRTQLILGAFWRCQNWLRSLIAVAFDNRL